MTMMTKNPIAFAKQMDDFMASTNSKLDRIIAHLGLDAAPSSAAPGAEGEAAPPSEHEPPKAPKKKA
jgi:hypothetical protein